MDQNTTSGAAGNQYSLAYDLPVSFRFRFAMLAIVFLIFACLVYMCFLQEQWKGKESLRLMPVVMYRRDSEANSGCVVCLGNFEEGEELKILGCGHLFHPECIEQWVLHHCSCPVCRCSDIFGGNHRVSRMAAAEESGVEVVEEGATEESGVEVVEEGGGDLGVRLERSMSWSDRVAGDGMRVAAIRRAGSF